MYESNNIMGIFNEKAIVGSPIVSGIDNLFAGNNKTVMQKVSSTQHLAKVSSVNMSALKPDAINANPDLTGMKATAMQSREQVASAAAGFASEVKNVQSVMDGALKQAAKNLNINPKHAAMTIKPAPSTTHADAAGSMGADVMLGGLAGIAAISYGAIQDILQERNHLPPKQEAKLLAKMQELLSPKRDENGTVVQAAEIPSQFDLCNIEAKEIKELYMPPERHPEGRLFANMLHKLDTEILPELDTADVRKANNTGNKLNEAIEKGDGVAVTAIVKNDDVLANAMLKEPTMTAGEIEFQVATLGDFSGIETNKEEIYSLNNDSNVKKALASFNNEYKLNASLSDNDPSLSTMTA